MEHVPERVASPFHEALHVVVAVRARAVVHGQHRSHVGVDHEAREHPQHVIEVVRPGAPAALGVGHRDHPVDRAGGHPGRGPIRDLADEAVGARGGGEHHHEVARPDPATAGAPVAVEGRAGVRGLDLRSRHEGALVEIEGLDGVGEVRLPGQLEVDVALRERLQDLLVADVLARREGTRRDSEREAPREEPGTRLDRLANEAMALENRVRYAKLPRAVRDHGSRRKAPRRDGDVVAPRGNPCYPVE